MIGQRQPAHFTAMHSARTVNYYFHNADDARTAHNQAKEAGRKPRTTKLVNHRMPDGTPVYYWKVTALEPRA